MTEKETDIPQTITWFKFYARKFGHCEKCGYKYNLTLHHKDGNPNSNNVTNFELLCSRKEYFFGLIKIKGCHPREEIKMIEKFKYEDQPVIQGTEKPKSKINKIISIIKGES